MTERSSDHTAALPRPEDMRQAVAGYVQEIHRAYVDQAATFPPAVRGAMPLMRDRRFTVAAVGTRNLHILATEEDLGPPQGQEVALDGELGGVSWQLRFFDPVVLPELALVDETEQPGFADVKRALGVTTVIYHFVAQPGAGLSAHQASHVGTGLANGHSAVRRDFDTIRSRARGREVLVDEMAGAARAGLTHAQALLARQISPHNAGCGRGLRRGAARPGRRAQGPAGRPRWPHPVGAPRRGSTVTADGGLSSVGNAARLLKVFLSREKELGVSELARRLGLGKSTVHRLLTTLVVRGPGRAEHRDRRLPAGPGDVRARPGRAGAHGPARRRRAGARLVARGDPRELPGRRPRRARGRLRRPARELAHAAADERDRPPGPGALHVVGQGAAGPPLTRGARRWCWPRRR